MCVCVFVARSCLLAMSTEGDIPANTHRDNKMRKSLCEMDHTRTKIIIICSRMCI